jgi:hypothetical protein
MPLYLNRAAQHRKKRSGIHAQDSNVRAATGIGKKHNTEQKYMNSNAEVKECVELYLHSPIRLHGVVLSLKKAQGHLCLHLTTRTETISKLFLLKVFPFPFQR